MERDDLKSIPKPIDRESNDRSELCKLMVFVIAFLLITSSPAMIISLLTPKDNHVLEIELVSMDFAAKVHNDSTILQSARWDLLIRVPGEIVGDYICLQGNLEASLLYKNVILATSSIQSYNKLELGAPQLLNVSAVGSEKDLSGAIGKEIMEAIKERNELRFGSRFSLTDCRKETEKGTMSYECGEATLRFESSGSDHIKATAFGKHPTCIFNL